MDDEVEELFRVDVFFKHEAVVVFPDLLRGGEIWWEEEIIVTWYIFAGRNLSRL